MWSAMAFLVLASGLVVGCGGSDDDGGGAGGASGSGGSAGVGGVGGVGGGAGSAGQGGAAGSSGSAGSAGSGASAGAADSAGGSNLLFRDDFDAENPAWTFDSTDPQASYAVQDGALHVTGGSLQAFGWLPLDSSWGDDLEITMGFRISSGLAVGPVVRADTTFVNGVNCNLREDLDQLRAARHDQRVYVTFAQAPMEVSFATDYSVTARVVGSDLTCTEAGGATVALAQVPAASGQVGFYVYQATAEIEFFEVRRVP